MNQVLKKTIFGLSCGLGLTRFGRRATRESALILMFHGFSDRKHGELANCDGKHLNVQLFAQFLDYLLKHHYVEKLENVVRDLKAGTPLRPNTVVLSFDDGYQSNYRLAFPELEKRSIPASIYLATEYVDEKKPTWTDRVEYAIGNTERTSLEFSLGKGQPTTLDLSGMDERLKSLIRLKQHLKGLPMEEIPIRVGALEEELECALEPEMEGHEIYAPLEWDEVATMQASGLISFGAHTHTHKILSRCQPETATFEVQKSKKIIEERTGSTPELFCYPNGNSGDFNDETGKLLEDEGFSCALTTVFGWNSSDANPHELKRIGVIDGWQPTYFKLMASGTLPWLKRQL